MKKLMIPLPDERLIKEEIDKWENELLYSVPEEVLCKMFKDYPNDRIENVLRKCYFLNSVYGTRVSTDDLKAISRYIYENHRILKTKFDDGDPSAVGILTCEVGEKNNYSFATKFCSFSKPDTYPIYDSLVFSVLKNYKKHQSDKKLSRLFRNVNYTKADDLKEYEVFKNVIDLLKEKSNSSYKDLDHFLWFYGKRYNLFISYLEILGRYVRGNVKIETTENQLISLIERGHEDMFSLNKEIGEIFLDKHNEIMGNISNKEYIKEIRNELKGYI